MRISTLVAASSVLTAICLPGVASAQITTTGRYYPAKPAKAADEPTKPLSKQATNPPAQPAPTSVSKPVSPAPTDHTPDNAVSQGSIEDGSRISLACVGAGAANKTDVVTANSSVNIAGNGGWANGSGTSTIYGTRTQQFGDQVSLYIEGGAGRIRMPRAMLPAIRGGEDGWFELRNIQIKDNEVTASIRVNPLNNPKLRIDRFSGSISISGKSGDYTGRCERFDPERTQKAF